MANQIRKSQLITPWGVGSIIPFPDKSCLMIAGLDAWDYTGLDDNYYLIQDERLKKWLDVSEFRTPPDSNNKCNIKIPAVRFPMWYYCPYCGTMKKLKSLSADHPCCPQYDWKKKHGLRSCVKPTKMIPERFIVACPNGHIHDFPFMEWVHELSGKPITSDCILRRSTGARTSTLAGVTYTCSCGAKRSMANAFIPDILGKIFPDGCNGNRPWMGDNSHEKCGCRDLRVMQRGASNLWFAEVESSISIPWDNYIGGEEIERILDRNYDLISGESDNEPVLKFIASSNNIEYDVLKKAYLARREGKNNISDKIYNSEEEYRNEEYISLIKNSGSDSKDLYTKNYPIEKYAKEIRPFFKSISLVHRLHETRVLYGFSRIKPGMASSKVAAKKSLSKNQTWLPAIKVFGEGIFFQFNEDLLEEWAQKEFITDRTNKLEKNYNEAAAHNQKPSIKLNPKYILLHTFAHVLINQLSFECGYSTSSIRERIYCDKTGTLEDMNGVLIYTASGDSDGSLGGLVRLGTSGRIEDTILSAMENAKWCASDPLCINSLGQGTDSCNLAACHNCVLLPETSCENGNKLLDRAMLIGNLVNPNEGFFSGMLDND